MIYQVNSSVQVCEGQQLNNKVPNEAKATTQPSPQSPRPINVRFNGRNGEGMSDYFVLSEKLLSQHLMLIGGIGSGKTNTFNHIMASIMPQLTARDVMIIFDTKGDFYKEFYKPGDIVISNDSTAKGTFGTDYWNIIEELEDDGHLMENAIEIATALFAEKLKNSGENAFFSQAARDITSAILFHFAKKKQTVKSNNKLISDFLKSESLRWYNSLLGMYPQFQAMQNYIPAEAPEQAVGVLGEIQNMVRQVFVGNFAKAGTLSIRNLVRNKGGKKIFIEYDIGIGGMLKPIYSLIFDLAIKEALCRAKSDGNVFFVCDEFKLLPNLQHIDDAVNFGRSLGIKFMIGIQNIDQIIEIYDENMTKNMFSGFLNQIAFKVNDHSTRNYLVERFGVNRKRTLLKGGTGTQESIERANVVEDWDVLNLKLGEAIVGVNYCEPFKFRFEEYISKK